MSTILQTELEKALRLRTEEALTEKIDVDLVDFSPFQPRKSFPEDKIRSLALSIEDNGQLIEIWVRPMGDRYELMAGQRRVLAIRYKGQKNNQHPFAKAKIIECNDKEAAQLCAIENVREDLLPSEKARQCQILRDGGSSMREIADCLGRPAFTESRIAEWLQVAELPERVQTMLDDRQIKMTHVSILSCISGPENQFRAANLASTGKLSKIQLSSRTQHLPRRENVSTSRVVVTTPKITTISEEALIKSFIRLDQEVKQFSIPKEPTQHLIEQAQKLLTTLCDLVEGLPKLK
jgi:ParB/RepB/Spo0J family partition protein